MRKRNLLQETHVAIFLLCAGADKSDSLELTV